jgi:hypothetical protein
LARALPAAIEAAEAAYGFAEDLGHLEQAIQLWDGGPTGIHAAR